MSRFIFGPFELDPLRLELRRDGIKLNVGPRACRVLLALIERAGRVVSQSELLAAAWPGLHVEDVNLRVHIVALRKALSAGSDCEIDITTLPREGYLFAASVSLAGEATKPLPLSPLPPPRPVSPLVGRREELAHLGDMLCANRIVTIVGPSGIGKTALALATVASPSSIAEVECLFVDFSTSVSSEHVAGRLFGALEFEGQPNDIVAHLVRALESRTILFVFDNCEHVIDAVSNIVVRLTSGTKAVSILATSREPLRVPGECVFPLEPLGCSPEGAKLTAMSAMSYPAIQMFAEAAGMRSRNFAVEDSNASLLGEICRRLDGIPLAIELAAATSDTMTIHELARRLDDRFAVLTRGTRTALPRHRTLQAALDWSYDALSEEEASVMRRLGVFPGRFVAADAEAIAAIDALSVTAVRNALADLVAKSLVTVDISKEIASFRYLESMRVYARLKLLESDEGSRTYTRFVDHTLGRLTELKQKAGALEDLKPRHSSLLDDWRAAHDWATRTGDWHTALALMEAAIGLCHSLNIKTEYVERSSATLRAIPEDVPDSDTLRLEMRVWDQHAQMLSDTLQDDPIPLYERIEVAASRSMELAIQLEEREYQWSALLSLTYAALTGSNVEKMRACSAMLDEVLQREQDRAFQPTARYLSGWISFNRNDYGAALRKLDKALVGVPRSKPGTPIAYDHIPSVRVIRSRALWLQGEFQSSLDEVDEALRSAIEGGHAATIAWVALGGGACVHMWAGTLERAAASAQLFEDLASEHSYPGWASYVPFLREALGRLSDDGRSFGAGPVNWKPYAPFHADMMTTIHCAFHRSVELRRVEAEPQHWSAPEHFRAAGEQHLVAGRGPQAEAYFQRALTLSKAQGAVAWEIRATLSLARLRLQQDEATDAHALLEPLIDRFRDSRVNADLVYASELLSLC